MKKRNQAQLLTSRVQAINEVLNQSAECHRAPNWSQVNKSLDSKKLVAAVNSGYQSQSPRGNIRDSHDGIFKMVIPLINTNQGKIKKSDSLMPNGSCSLRYRNSSNDAKEP